MHPKIKKNKKKKERKEKKEKNQCILQKWYVISYGEDDLLHLYYID